MADKENRKGPVKLKEDPPYVLIIVFIVFSSVIVFSGYAYYRSYKKTITDNIKNELASVCNLKVEQLVQWRKEMRTYADYMFNNKLRASQVNAFLRDPGSQQVKKELLTWLKWNKNAFNYKEIAVFDSEGKVVLSSEKDTGQDKSHILLARSSLEKKSIVFGDLYKHEASGEIDLGLFIPLIDKEKRMNGGVMLLTDPEKFIYPSIQSWPVPSETAETLLLRNEGTDALYLNELRHMKNTALILRVPLTRDDIPAVKAVKGEHGFIKGVDYRNVPVLTFNMKVPDTTWVMLAKIDASEAYESVRKSSVNITAFVFVGIITTGFGLGFFWRNKKAVFYQRLLDASQELNKSEERLRVILEATADGILAVDSSGKTILANKRFAELWRIPQQLINSGDDRVMLDFVLEQLKDPEAFLNKVMALYGTTEIDNDTILFKDGRTFERYSTPMFNDGALIGRLWSFRDITERKMVEDALRKNEANLIRAERIAKIGHWEWNIPTNELIWSDEVYRLYGVPLNEKPSYDIVMKTIAPECRDQFAAAIEDALKHSKPFDGEYRMISLDGTSHYTHTTGEVIRDHEGHPLSMFGIVQNITERKKAEEIIKSSLAEKDVMLKEIHHRVKNNMQIMSSLLNLQSKKIQSVEVRKMFEETRNRIKAMAFIHEMLYDKKNLSNINSSDYLNKLVEDLISVIGERTERITVKCDIDEIILSIDRAIPLGLITNELVTNALKYAFPGRRKGELSISLTKGRDVCTLSVKDNGVGLPEGLDYRDTGTLGLLLVSVMSEQIKGKFSINRENGTEAVITFMEG